MSKRVVSTILRETSSHSVSVEELRSKVRLDPKLLECHLHTLVEASLISILDDSIHVSPQQKIRLALKALSIGCSLDGVCRGLSWSEFEDFCLEVLYSNGFDVSKHFRFKACKRRWEIDLLAVEGSKMMLIDCKHWNRGHQANSLRKAAERNLACAKAFLKVMPRVYKSLRINELPSLCLLPVIITLLRSPVQIHLGVPIVSISQLNEFIYELPKYLTELAFFPVQLKGS